MNKHLLVCLFSAATLGMGAQVVPNLWHEYKANPNAHPNIPNCSYAGYRYGDAPLPTGSSKIFDVTSFGAVVNDSGDDVEAIRKALVAAENAGGGVVYLPNGEYVCSGVLFINGNNIIIRGESRQGTTIKFTNSLTSGYAPNYSISGNGSLDQRMWSWCGGMVWITPKSKNTYLESVPENLFDKWAGSKKDRYYMADGEAWNVANELTVTTSEAQRGDFTFGVADASNLKPGQYISIRYKNPSDWSLQKFLTGDGRFANSYNWSNGTGWISPTNRPYIDWIVQIESVSGNEVTLMQPLRIPLRRSFEPKVMAMGELISESGIENITLELEKDYESDYGGSWRNANHNREYGWNGVYMNNAVNCFARNVTVYDSEMSFGTAASKNVTFTDVSVCGKDRRKSTHHGFTCRVQSQDILFENFEFTNYELFDHGINVEDFSMGNVWHSGIVIKGCFDTHRLMPVENVRTNIKVKVGGGYGGAGEAGPQIGARFVHWNVELKDGNTSTIVPVNTMPMGALVGITGAIVNSSEVSGCIVEACNLGVAPNDLYIGQKDFRNGVVQESSLKTPWPVWEVDKIIEAENAKINDIGFDNDACDEEMGEKPGDKNVYLKAFYNVDAIAEYDINIPKSGVYTFNFRVSAEGDQTENYLAIEERGIELGHIEFAGRGRDRWETKSIDIKLNPGIHTFQLRGRKGGTCLNKLWVDPAFESSEVNFPIFSLVPGKYNVTATVELISTDPDATVYYILNGSTPKVYSEPIELTETTTVETFARKGSKTSLRNSAVYEITPPPTVPCRINSDDYVTMKGMGKINGNGPTVLTGSQGGDYAEYYVNCPSAGEYIINCNVTVKGRGEYPNASYKLFINDVEIYDSGIIPSMGGNWDKFKQFPTSAHFNYGINKIKYVVSNPRIGILWMEIRNATAISLPGIVEAENFNIDSSFGMSSTIDTGAGRQPGYEMEMSEGKCYYYDVDMKSAGTYDVTFLVSSRKGNGTGTLFIDGQEIASYEAPQVSSANQASFLKTTATFPAGKFVLTLKPDKGSPVHHVDKIYIGVDPDDNPQSGVENNLGDTDTVFYDSINSTIKVNGYEGDEYILVNLLGIIARHGVSNGEESIDLSNLSVGCYVFKIGDCQMKIIVK